MLKKYKYKNWHFNYPNSLLEYLFTPCPRGLRFVNFVYQKIIGLNRQYPFMIHFTSIVNGNIIFGKNVARYFAVSGGCYIQGINGIEIGDNSIFAPGVKILSANHDFSDFSKHIKTNIPIRIGSNCWVGANAIILPEVQIGDNVIIGAGSVVTKNFECNVVIAGNPARVIKKLVNRVIE